MNITKDYLESLVTEDVTISRNVATLEKILDADLLFQTQMYGKIETYMPLYPEKFNRTYSVQLTSKEIADIKDRIVNSYKEKGFNVFLINYEDYEEISLIITNKKTFKNNVSDRYQKGETVVYKDGKKL